MTDTERQILKNQETIVNALNIMLVDYDGPFQKHVLDELMKRANETRKELRK